VWCFTDNYNSYQWLISQRLYNEVNPKKINVRFESSKLLYAETRADIVKKNKFDLNIKFSKIAKRNIELLIEFYDLPENIRENKDIIYNELNTLMKLRKQDINSL